MKGEPSSFDKHLVALKRVQKHSDMSKLLLRLPVCRFNCTTYLLGYQQVLQKVLYLRWVH